MQHGHLVEVYNKAQDHYHKKKFNRAKKGFEKIVSEIYASDTDCMADLNLCSSSESYLEEINELNLNRNLYVWILFGVVVTAVVIFLFLK